MEQTSSGIYDVQFLPLEDVYPDPDQPRDSMPDIDELAASIDRLGLMYPVTVRRIGEQYRLIDGERRWTAFMQLGRATIPARVAESDDDEIILLELAGNLHVPLTPEQQSRGVQRAFAIEAALPDIVAATGLPADTVERAHNGFKMAAKFYGDELEPTSLDRFAVLPEFADEPESVEQLLKASESEWRSVYSRLVTARKAAAAMASATAIVTDAGCEVVESGNGLRYLGQGDIAPDGATKAHIQVYGSTAYIYWYAEVDSAADDDAAELAAQKAQERDRIGAELQSAHDARWAHIVGLFDGSRIVNDNELRLFIMHAWDNGAIAESASLENGLETVTGHMARVNASILANIESSAMHVIRNAATNGPLHYPAEVSEAADYLDVLKSVGYELSEIETAAHKRMRRELDDAAEDGE